MSKQALQKSAYDSSGVSYQQSLVATELSPSLYERIGTEGFEELSQLFYNRVFADHEHRAFQNIFSSSTKAEAVENQYRFFVQTFGGPPLYKEIKGKYTRLVGRHANYAGIDHVAAQRWLWHMQQALNEHSQLQRDAPARDALMDYFTYTAHYIVVAQQYMRSDQLSGGTEVDKGRIW